MTASATALPATPLFNFRDLGGLTTLSHGRVRTGLLLRSGHHARLSAEARDALIAQDFALIVDLRYPVERVKDVSPWPTAWADRVLAHDKDAGTDAPHIALLAAAGSGEAAVHSAYRQLYAAMPFDPVYRPLFAAAMVRLASTEGPVLVHCSAGKDRTGVFVALLLDLFDVPRDAIVADYLKSAHSPVLLAVRNELVDKLTMEELSEPEAIAAALVGVRADYLDAMFAAIDDRCGGTEAYFAAGTVSADHIAHVRARYIKR